MVRVIACEVSSRFPVLGHIFDKIRWVGLIISFKWTGSGRASFFHFISGGIRPEKLGISPYRALIPTYMSIHYYWGVLSII